jgi:hypothetical protein
MRPSHALENDDRPPLKPGETAAGRAIVAGLAAKTRLSPVASKKHRRAAAAK